MSNPSPSALQDIVEVASFELRETWSSRVSMVLLALYGGFTLFAAFGYAAVIRLIGSVTNETLNIEGQDPMVSGEELLKNENVQIQLEGMENIQGMGLDDPPMVIFFRVVCGLAVPLLVLLLSSQTVARDIKTGAIRYSLVRVGKLELILGRALAHGFLHAVVQISMIPVALLAGAALLPDFAWGETVGGLSVASFQAWLWGLCFLGVALYASQISNTPFGAQATGLTLAMVMLMAHGFLQSTMAEKLGPVAGFLDFFTPFAHSPFSAGGLEGLVTVIKGLALSCGWMLLGLFVLRGRNL